MQMVDEQPRARSEGPVAPQIVSARPRKTSRRAVGVSEWQWRLMLAALGLLALVMLGSIVLFILAAFGGLSFALFPRYEQT